MQAKEDTLEGAILAKYASEWKTDADMNELDIAAEIRRVPNLHAKWLAYIARHKMDLRTLAKQFLILRKLKVRYYRGELGKDDLVKYGWQQWQGNRPMKSEMEDILKGDTDLAAMEDRITNTETIIWTLEQVLRSIHQRGYDLKTMLAAKQFYSGN